MAEGHDCVPGLSGLPADERRLVRLYRCMLEWEQDAMLAKAAKTIMRRLPVCPPPTRPTPRDLELVREELSPENVENLESRLMGLVPYSWPPGFIELDILGDPGLEFYYWIRELEPDFLLGREANDRQSGSELAARYIEQLSSMGALEGDEDDDEFCESWTIGFIGFLREWRERLIRSFEKQMRENCDEAGEKV